VVLSVGSGHYDFHVPALAPLPENHSSPVSAWFWLLTALIVAMLVVGIGGVVLRRRRRDLGEA
jgi:LPXTG-motif cell wall-anchored protein